MYRKQHIVSNTFYFIFFFTRVKSICAQLNEGFYYILHAYNHDCTYNYYIYIYIYNINEDFETLFLLYKLQKKRYRMNIRKKYDIFKETIIFFNEGGRITFDIYNRKLYIQYILIIFFYDHFFFLNHLRKSYIKK